MERVWVLVRINQLRVRGCSGARSRRIQLSPACAGAAVALNLL